MKKFFKKIFSSSAKEEPNEPSLSKHPELEDAWRYLQEGKFEECIQSASKCKDSDHSSLKYEANKLIGLGNFKLGNFNESQGIFQSLAGNSNNPDDWFNLVTSATLHKDFELGRNAFNKAVELYRQNGTQENLSIPNMMYFYMQCLKNVGQYEQAFEQLNGLKELYSGYKITDATFLYLRGMPFFEHTADAAVEILREIDKNRSEDWINSFKKAVDEDGVRCLVELEEKLSAEEMHQINLQQVTKAEKGIVELYYFENKHIGLKKTLFHRFYIPLAPFNSGIDYEEQPVETKIVIEWLELNLEDPTNLDGLKITSSPEDETEVSIYIGSAHNPCDILDMNINKLEDTLFEVDCKLFIDFEHEGVAKNEEFYFKTQLDLNSVIRDEC